MRNIWEGSSRLKWTGHVDRTEEEEVLKRAGALIVDGGKEEDRDSCGMSEEGFGVSGSGEENESEGYREWRK